jgi:hypothetical protein
MREADADTWPEATLNFRERRSGKMGIAKDALLEKEEARAQKFDEIARKNNWRCSICDQIISEEDEPTYYFTRMCGLHAYQMEKY